MLYQRKFRYAQFLYIDPVKPVKVFSGLQKGLQYYPRYAQEIAQYLDILQNKLDRSQESK